MEGDNLKTSKSKKLDTTSSVFLSPPSSNDFAVCSKSRSKISRWHEHEDKPKFCLEEDEDNDQGEGCSGSHDIKLDILAELFNRNLITIIGAKILDYLSETELLKVSHVNTNWRAIVQFHMKSGMRIKRFLKRKRNTYAGKKENCSGVKDSKIQPARVPGTPFKLVNLKVESEEKPQSSTFQTPLPLRDPNTLYKHCPDCNSPSRTTSKKSGHCTKCNQDFCLHCYYTKNEHSPSCIIAGGSGVRGSPARKIEKGSKKWTINKRENKERLKRL